MTRLSEDDTEALLRDGLARLASRAPDANEVLDALSRAKAPRRRPATLLVAAAAAVVIVAVGVPMIVHSLGEDSPSADTSATAQVNWQVLQFHPTWLPDGFTEQYREVSPGSRTQVRRWRQGQVGAAEITLSTFSSQSPEWSGTALKIATLPDQIVIGGRVGMVTGDGTSAMVTWMPDAARVLQLKLTGVPDARDAGKRIAGSIGHSATALRSELDFGPLPAGLVPMSSLTEGLSPSDADSGVKAATTAEPGTPVLRADISAHAPALQNAADVEVRGREGSYLAGKRPDADTVAVQLANGRWLTITGSVSKDELLAVANSITVDASPDYAWIGR
jgi:hypothetical protein